MSETRPAPESPDVKSILALCSSTSADGPEDDADTWRTAQEMGRALAAKYPVRYLSGADPSVFAELQRLQPERVVVLNMMERSEDASWPAVFERMGLAYTGCDAFALLLSTNKSWMKLFAERAGMRVAKGRLLTGPTTDRLFLQFPVIIKPVAEDASVGIRQENLCRTQAAMCARMVELAKDHPGPWLVEEYIPGTDATLPLFAENGHARILPALEVRFDRLPPGGLPILSYEAKWLPDSPLYTGHTEVCPADLPEKTLAEMTAGAESLVETLNLTGYVRIDFRLDETRRPWFLELNGNPRLSEKDCYFVKAAKHTGMSYFDILETLVSSARRRKTR